MLYEEGTCSHQTCLWTLPHPQSFRPRSLYFLRIFSHEIRLTRKLTARHQSSFKRLIYDTFFSIDRRVTSHESALPVQEQIGLNLGAQLSATSKLRTERCQAGKKG